MNIEQLVDPSKTSTLVKVIIVNPNGRVRQINEFHEITKKLIVNLTQKKNGKQLQTQCSNTYA